MHSRERRVTYQVFKAYFRTNEPHPSHRARICTKLAVFENEQNIMRVSVNRNNAHFNQPSTAYQLRKATEEAPRLTSLHHYVHRLPLVQWRNIGTSCPKCEMERHHVSSRTVDFRNKIQDKLSRRTASFHLNKCYRTNLRSLCGFHR